MKIQQRDIVELNFELPNGKFKTHPALVILNQAVMEAEDIFYALMISTKSFNDEFSFELTNSMLTKNLKEKSFVKCQLVQAYSTGEVLTRISSVKSDSFQFIKQKFFESVF